MLSAPTVSVSEGTIKATAVVAFVAVLAIPVYHKHIKPKFKGQELDAKKDDDAGRGRRGRLSRRPSVLEELTSVPLVLRAMLWLQCFQGLMLWLSPKIIAEVYGVTDMSPLATMLCEDFGRMWTGLHFGALVSGRKGVSTATVISSGLVFLLLSELKALFNDEYLGGNTPNRVVILIVIKLASLWALEYGPEISIQEGILAETLSKVIPTQEHIGQFMAFYVALDGACMYAAFWGYAINDELLRFLTVVAGEGFMMMGAFWFTLLRGEHAWKAYGVAALVYFGCTVDVGFISKTGWFIGEAGVWVDLILSYITIITAQPWTIFM
eukprot:scaffold22438_cov140-Skeletonema_marinoi.AAC.1